MKRFAAIIFLMLLASLAFAEYVEEMDGHDWRQFSVDQKIGYVQGFYSAYSSVWERFVYEMGNTISQEDNDRMEELFFIQITIGDMVNRLDEFYNTYKNREFKLYEVLMWIAGKDYWN